MRDSCCYHAAIYQSKRSPLDHVCSAQHCNSIEQCLTGFLVNMSHVLPHSILNCSQVSVLRLLATDARTSSTLEPGAISLPCPPSSLLPCFFLSLYNHMASVLPFMKCNRSFSLLPLSCTGRHQGPLPDQDGATRGCGERLPFFGLPGQDPGPPSPI
jgi:hypothetical protein